MDKILQAQFFEVSVGGVLFKVRRRSALVMAEARGLMAVLGQVAGANGPPATVDEAKAAAMIRSVVQAALVEFYDDDAGQWAPVWDRYTVDQLGPFLDLLFTAFMGSGLSLDPMPASCGD